MSHSPIDDDITSSIVPIFGKQFTIRCPADKVDDLQKCARYVDQKMRQVRDKSRGKIAGTERIAIMAALEISHELLMSQEQKNGNLDMMNADIQALQAKIEAALQHTPSD